MILSIFHDIFQHNQEAHNIGIACNGHVYVTISRRERTVTKKGNFIVGQAISQRNPK